MTPAEFAVAVGQHRVTIYRALECGELHGHKPRGRWHIDPGAVEPWKKGGDTATPCGCSNVTKFRRRRTA